MAIQRTIVNGEHAIVADMPGGYVKVLFDDGRMIIGTKSDEVKKYSPDQPREPDGKFGEGDRGSEKTVVYRLGWSGEKRDAAKGTGSFAGDAARVASHINYTEEADKAAGDTIFAYEVPKVTEWIKQHQGNTIMLADKAKLIGSVPLSDVYEKAKAGMFNVTGTHIESLFSDHAVKKYSPDQPRAANGQFGEGGTDKKPTMKELFSNGLGMKRGDMPQIPGAVKEKFLDEQRALGVTVTRETVPARSLKPTQSEYNEENINYLRQVIGSGKGLADNPILVSSDNRILDGHHRWAVEAEAGHSMPIIRVGIPITELLSRAAKFNKENGIAARTKDMADAKKIELFDELEKMETYAMRYFDTIIKSSEPGHPFYGNQYTDGQGAAAAQEPQHYGSAQSFINANADIPLASRMSMEQIGVLASLYASSQAQKPKFDAAVREIADKIGAKTDIPNTLKGPDRASQKIEGDYAGQAIKIKDLMRATVIVDNPTQANAVISYFRKNYEEVGVTRNLFTDDANPVDGYRDAKMNIKVPGDHIAEVQVNCQEMLDAKKIGHEPYEERSKIERIPGDVTPENAQRIRELNEQMKAIYAPTWERIRSRSNVSKSTAVPFRDSESRENARGGATSYASTRNPPLESFSTLTGTPSTSQYTNPSSPGHAIHSSKFSSGFIKYLSNRMYKMAIDAAAHEAATSTLNARKEPTDRMKSAGNYRKGHITINGIDIAIENPAGSRRRPQWPVLQSHYGYIKNSVMQSDGDQVDVFVKPQTDDSYSGPVWVIAQEKPDGSFDEYKCMIGWESKKKACAAYLENYTKGWKLGDVMKFTFEEFRDWVYSKPMPH